jgi:acetolactate synthase I/II/III large subunit
MIRLADYVFQCIAEAGVQDIFMVPGGAAMHLNDAAGGTSALNVISNLHEQASAICAEGYARISGGFGCCMVTAGPGGTNAITGLAGAYLDSTPVIFLSGQVKRADLKGDRGVRQYGVQEIDIISIVKPLTKYAVTITDPEKIRYHLEKAMYLARNGRSGPVWLDFPLDVQGAQIEPSQLPGFDPIELQQSNLDRELQQPILEFADLLKTAERPIILVGNGVRMAGAVSEFLEVVEQLGVPVLTTWLAMDSICADHPLYAGRPGGMAPRGANFAIQNSDLLICIGTRIDLGMVGYSYENLARGAKKVVVDIDEAEIRKLGFKVDLPVVSDAGDFLRAILDTDLCWSESVSSTWMKKIQAWHQKYPLLVEDQRDPTQPLSAYNFSDTLCDELTEGDILAPGSSGFACEIFLLCYRNKLGQRMYHNRGTGSMGFGLPSSIGACIASGRKQTICVDGDGGFQMNIQELEVVSRLNLPIKFFVINNNGYASIRSSQDGYFQRKIGSDSTSGLTLPNIIKVAAAYGLPTQQISNPVTLREDIRRVLDTPGPILCEVIVRADEPRIPRLASFRKPDGSMASRPLEDLFPFLDRDEFISNMIVPILAESSVS